MSDDATVALDAAVTLFNDGRYLAAHELLDELWEAGEGGDADFFKGLIQASIAMHHFAEGNLDGAARLHSGHRRFLGAYLPEHRGVDVAALLASMQACLRPVVARQPGETPRFDPAQRPEIVRTKDRG